MLLLHNYHNNLQDRKNFLHFLHTHTIRFLATNKMATYNEDPANILRAFVSSNCWRRLWCGHLVNYYSGAALDVFCWLGLPQVLGVHVKAVGLLQQQRAGGLVQPGQHPAALLTREQMIPISIVRMVTDYWLANSSQCIGHLVLFGHIDIFKQTQSNFQPRKLELLSIERDI